MGYTRKARSLGLVLVGLLVGMLLITPATAHFTQNTRHLGVHAWNQVIKAKADQRYLPTTVQYVRSNSITLAVNSGTDASVACPSGFFATGGGVASNATVTFHNFLVLSSHPSNGNTSNAGRTGWHVRVRNNSPEFERSFRVYVICVRAGKTPGNYVDGQTPTFTGDAEGRAAG